MNEHTDLTRNSILRISDEKTIQLIQEWEKEECLWNTNKLGYPNRDERLLATATIAEKLNLPNFRPEHVAMKFKNLRNSYCQELKKIAADEKYKPKVFWFSHMDKFLKPHLQKSKFYKDETKVSEDKPKYVIKTEIESDNEQHDSSVDNSNQSEASCSNSYLRIESIYTERCPSDISEQSQAKKRKLSMDSNKSINVNEDTRSGGENGECSQQSLSKNDDTQMRTRFVMKDVAKQPVPRQEDYFDKFGAYVASLLRTLPPKKALMLQPEILELIVSVGVEQLKDNDSDS